jgi:cation transport protein ChaC
MPELWVFAYGSLIWDTGFEPAERVRAVAAGWRRSFCLWSVHWRGTPEAPGLVLGLEEEAGASCEGMALRVAGVEAGAVLAALRARELVSNAYEERRLPLRLADGRAVEAVAYVIRPGHPQHARLDPEAQAAVIARAVGQRGPNRDYLEAAAAALEGMGIADPGLGALRARVRALGAAR